MLLISLWLVRDNRFMEYAPNYERTITHTDFNNLIEATTKLEDISTMERVFRWVAGFRMVADRPWVGFGPNSFYTRYYPYTLSAFRTYVSDNPEKSTVHCYFLLLGIEQGIPALVLFLVLGGVLMRYGERYWHKYRKLAKEREPDDPAYATLRQKQHLIMATVVSLVINFNIQLINDMIETIKTGGLFFLCIALLLMVGVDRGQEEQPIDVSSSRDE